MAPACYFVAGRNRRRQEDETAPTTSVARETPAADPKPATPVTINGTRTLAEAARARMAA
jgi:hypothetical protein